MDPISTGAVITGVAVNEATGLISKIVTAIWNRSNRAMMLAAVRETESYLHTKEATDDSLKPLLAFLKALRTEQQIENGYNRDALDRIEQQLDHILRNQLSPDAKATLNLQKWLVPGTESLSEDPSQMLPGQMLRAGSEVVPFIGREAELDRLRSIMEIPESISICLMTGPGGTGKTRLMVRWIDELIRNGTIAGFLHRSVGEDDVGLMFEGHGKRAVVIDYAETKVSLVKKILELAEHRGREQNKLNLILVARRAGEWWEHIGEGNHDVHRLAHEHSRYSPLDPLLQNVEEKVAHFNDAINSFTNVLSVQLPNSVKPDLTDDHFKHPLYVQMAALAAVNGKIISDADKLLEATVEHERAFWDRIVKDTFDTNSEQRQGMRAIKRALPILTLWGGSDSKAVTRKLLQSDRSLTDSSNLVEDINDIIWRLYGETESGAQRLRPLEPDLLGEQLVLESLNDTSGRIDTNELLDAAVQLGTDEGRAQMLTALARLIQRKPDAELYLDYLFSKHLTVLWELAITVAVETGDPVGHLMSKALQNSQDVNIAESIMKACPARTISLLELAVVSTQIVYENRKANWKDPNEEQLNAVADLAHSLSIRYADIREFEKALETAAEAVKIQRELFARQPADYRPGFAASLANLSTRCSNIGQLEDALKFQLEAIEHYRQLSELNPDEYLPTITTVQNNLGNTQKLLEQYVDAESTLLLAVKGWRTLVKKSNVHFPSLAMALNNLGIAYQEQNKGNDALNSLCEALYIYRKLSSKYPDSFRADVAVSLNNRAAVLWSMKKKRLALMDLTEAVEIYRNLAKRHPDSFRPDLAVFLNSLGVYLSSEKKHTEAFDVLEESAHVIAPYFFSCPSAYLQQMTIIIRNYTAYAEMADKVIDEELVSMAQMLINHVRVHWDVDC